MRQTALAMTLITVLLITVAAATEHVYAESTGTYIPLSGSLMTTIKADGSIEPESANISRNGNIYTLVADVEGYIVLEQSNCIFDGAGHAVGGVYGPIPVQVGYQYQVNDVSGVTVINMVVNGGGIIFYGLKSNNLVIANNILNNGTGIDCSGGGNLIANNTINFGRGIGCGGDGNTVSGNRLANCNYTFVENNPPPYGISITGSSNIIFGNTISETKGDAIHLIVGVSKNVIAGNQIIGNRVGVHTIYMMSQGGAEGNLIYNNNFIGNTQNVYNEAVVTTAVSVNFWDNGKEGNYWSDYNGQGTYVIDKSNVDNHPLTSPVDISKLTIDSLSRAPLPTPIPTPTSTPSTAPTTTPTPNPTTSPAPSPTPQKTEAPTESSPYSTVVVVAVFVAAATAAGLLVYFKKRKR